MEDGDYYELLGVQSTASDEALKRAYKRQALLWHPDKHPGPGPERDYAEDRFRRVSEAYQVLSDAQKRAIYDRHGTLGDLPDHGPAPRVVITKRYGWSNFNISFGYVAAGGADDVEPAASPAHGAQMSTQAGEGVAAGFYESGTACMSEPDDVFQEVFGSSNPLEVISKFFGCHSSADKEKRMRRAAAEAAAAEGGIGAISDEELTVDASPVRTWGSLRDSLIEERTIFRQCEENAQQSTLDRQ